MGKRKKRALLWAAAVLELLLCLVPERRAYKDGGTVEYRALLYRATCWHVMVEASGNVEVTQEGLELRVLGFPVYDGRRLVETRYCG